MSKKYRIHEFAERVGRCTSTIRRWEREGKILPTHIAEENDCGIDMVSQESLSPQQEMVEDLMTIVHTFSCRLYGLRKYKKALKEDYPQTKIVRTETVE